MFGFYKKPCGHKNKVDTQISLSEGFTVLGADHISGDVERPVYFCQDCRVLFVPREKEKLHYDKRI